ncbi:MAG: ATP-grasp domain-containing protein [Proteobacteria bacterium]|nr:ATP-grasp domain-containing protein [Pseudomonadota bacterium]
MPKHIAFVEISSTGAGHTSLEYCRAQGYWVTLLCQHPEKLPPELTRDIHVVQTDTTDHAILLATALEVHTRRAINGITTSNDFFVPEAALLAAELGLPGMGYLAALSARNKYLTRLQLRTNGLDTLNPRFFLARSREYAHSCAEELRYPFIAKLQNANDSIGVVKIGSPSELDDYWEHWQGYTKLTTGQRVAPGILLEEFIDGDEYSLETVQGYQQERVVLGVTAKEAFLGSGGAQFTELVLTFPCDFAGANKAADMIGRGLDALGITCGLIHTEFRVTSNGDIKILEINPRLAGDMLGSHAIPRATGVDTALAMVECALGTQVDGSASKEGAATIVGLHSQTAGIFRGINTDELSRLPGVCDLLVWAHPGAETRFPRSNADLLGRMVVEGRDRGDALAKARAAYERVVVNVEPN